MKSDRKFELVLYPDATNYSCEEILAKAADFFDQWAYILHDKDIGDDGQPKKAHYHLIGRNKGSVLTPSGVAYQLGVPESSLANIGSWSASELYMCHDNAPDKYQYDVSDVVSNYDFKRRRKIDDDTQAQKILSYIMEHRIRNISDVTSWAIDNGYYAGFRRGFAIWSCIIRENAQRATNP